MGMYEAGEDVLCRVALHLLVALVKVDFARHGLPDCHGRIGEVIYHARLLAHVGHSSRLDVSAVGVLSALLGEKGGLIKDYSVAAVYRIAGEDGSRKLGEVGVFIIKLFCHVLDLR